MLFPTVEFGIFFFIVFTAGWLLKSHNAWRKLFLVLTNYFFYWSWDWRFTILLLFCSSGNYAFGRLLGSTENDRKRKIIVTLAVVFNLAILGFFKYYRFFTTSLNSLILSLGLNSNMPLLEILLPVGISFFTFQALTYIIDVYRKEMPATKSYLDLILYISFFPTLLAGPIMRAKAFLPQLQGNPDSNSIPAARAFMLIVAGLFKKVVIANYIATELVNPVFENPKAYSGIEVLLAAYGYAVQIYCDFAAYSEIAIGVASLLGFKIPDNFNYPYRAQSLQDFWRRWHISLSSWLKDYLYISFGGSRNGKWQTYRNLFITMLLGGLWHGAAWNFIFWGALHGSGLAVERFIRAKYAESKKSLWAQGVSVIIVFNFVCIGWVFFRAGTFSLAIEVFQAMANLSAPITILTPFVFLLLVIGIGMHFIPAEPGRKITFELSRLPLIAQGAILGALLVAINAFGPEGVAPFIYFQF